MFLDQFYNQNANQIHYSRQQASDFAKKIAGDFNAIHDDDAKLFCVPGDLLFATVLNQFGISESMKFTFSGMVTDGIRLDFSPSDDEQLIIRDENSKEYLKVERHGQSSHDDELIANLSQRYVEFSGQTFPHILVPLMKENGVMINTARPLVIYESMAIELEKLDISSPVLELANAALDVQGKRGNATLIFDLIEDGVKVGHGLKKMVLSGLREYDQQQIDQLVESYTKRKAAYQQQAA